LIDQDSSLFGSHASIPKIISGANRLWSAPLVFTPYIANQLASAWLNGCST
jgi:hypothetical protein